MQNFEKILSLDNDTLLKIEKCANQFSTALRTFGKVIESIRKNGTKIPDYGVHHKKTTETQPQEVSLDVQSPKKIGTKIPEAVLKQPETQKQIGTKIPENIDEWFFTRCYWGKHHAADVANYMIGNRVRGDRNGNFWELTGCNPGNRKHWQKRPRTHQTTLYEKYVEQLNDLAIMARRAKSNDSERWNHIHTTKRTRLFRIECDPITKKEFRQLLINAHEALPSLKSF